MAEEATVQLNYVIPRDIGGLLDQYCKQNLVTPSALIRRLVLEYIEGNRDVDAIEHPKGRRTTVALPERLLAAFEERIEFFGHKTKASVIASLLSGFLPNRVLTGSTIRVEVDLPTNVFNTIYEVFGPGPTETVIINALQSFVNSLATREVG